MSFMEELENEAARIWCDALRDAYKSALNERIRQLRGVHSRRFDSWGLHLFSECWGTICACEELFPFLRELRLPRDEGQLQMTATMMRELARSDADKAYALDIIEKARSDG